MEAFGYKLQQEFTLDFGEGKTADCIALEPPEKLINDAPWKCQDVIYTNAGCGVRECLQEYHLPPEIFVSDGNEGSIVGNWVEARGGIGGIHHIAYQVDDVAATMEEWRAKGYAEFSSDKPMTCPGLTQVFTKPSELTGIVYEFIKRDNFGFCLTNVKKLMESTKNY